MNIETALKSFHVFHISNKFKETAGCVCVIISAPTTQDNVGRVECKKKSNMHIKFANAMLGTYCVYSLFCVDL